MAEPGTRLNASDEACRRCGVATEHSVIYTTIALQYSAVLLGIAWARAARTSPRHVPTWWLLPAALSLMILGIAWFKSKVGMSSRADGKAWRLISALLAYDAIVMVFDPFDVAGDEASRLLGVALILLPLLCLKALVRRRAWLAILGGRLVPGDRSRVAALQLPRPAGRGWLLRHLGRMSDSGELRTRPTTAALASPSDGLEDTFRSTP